MFESRSWRGALDLSLCNKGCQCLAVGRCFSPRIPVSSIYNTYRHNVTETLLKVVLNTINLIQLQKIEPAVAYTNGVPMQVIIIQYYLILYMVLLHFPEMLITLCNSRK